MKENPLKTYNPLAPRNPKLAEKVRDGAKINDLIAKIKYSPEQERPKLTILLQEMSHKYLMKYDEYHRIKQK